MESEIQFWTPKEGEEFTLRFVDVPSRWKAKNGQMQCGLCGKFMRRESDFWGISWRCIDMSFDDYYGAWEHR
jgi:hypothetical protein